MIITLEDQELKKKIFIKLKSPLILKSQNYQKKDKKFLNQMMKFTLKKSKKSGTKLMNNMINFKNLLKILEYNTEKTILKEKLTKIHLEI